MNVPAKKIIEQMQNQMQKLHTSISNQDEQAVREAAAVIEGYCQLLKGEPLQKTHRQDEGPAYPVQPNRNEATPSIPLNEEGKGSRNLLDF